MWSGGRRFQFYRACRRLRGFDPRMLSAPGRFVASLSKKRQVEQVGARKRRMAPAQATAVAGENQKVEQAMAPARATAVAGEYQKVEKRREGPILVGTG